jgi:hypothetical protein
MDFSIGTTKKIYGMIYHVIWIYRGTLAVADPGKEGKPFSVNQ